MVRSKIQVQPYNYAAQFPIIAFGNKHGIVTEGYSPLASIRAYPGGPVDKPVNEIAKRLGCTPEQALMAWAKSKGIVVITSSRDKERVDAFLAAGDLGAYYARAVRRADHGGHGQSPHPGRHRCYR